MESLNIKQTHITPLVCFDIEKNLFELSEISQPENAEDFYVNIINWLKEFKEKHIELRLVKQLTINFKLEYYNTASIKYIAELMKIFKSFIEHDVDMVINWYYLEGDEEAFEDGMDISFAIDVPFNFISHT